MLSQIAAILSRSPAAFAADALGVVAIAAMTLGLLHLPAFV
jgi:hypothetical protein